MSIATALDASSEKATTPLSKVISALSRELDPTRRGSGSLAELRRIRDDYLPPRFWVLYLTVVPKEWREHKGKPDARHDRAWAHLTRAMVEMGANPLSFQMPFGRALAESGYSEARFVRLLRAEGEVIARELRTAGEWLAKSGVRRVNWMDPSSLFDWGPGMQSSARSARHRLARDYFSAAARQS